MIDVYDNIVDETTHKKVYEWAQSVSWYGRWIGIDNDLKHRMLKSINEYSPSIDGNYNSNHIWGSHDEINLFRFTIYRHPIGWTDKTTKERNPLIYNLWTQINDTVFNGKASIDGIPEPISGLKGPWAFYKDGQTFYKKYDVPKTQQEFTCYLNARCADWSNNHTSQIGGRMGQIHRDTLDFNFPSTYDLREGIRLIEKQEAEGENYYTVLYICNPKWQSDWGGELICYDDEKTGAKHWKHRWNIGWPCKIVGNKPNRVIVYKHNQTHSTFPPRSAAPEMSQKIAFRVKVKNE